MPLTRVVRDHLHSRSALRGGGGRCSKRMVAWIKSVAEGRQEGEGFIKSKNFVDVKGVWSLALSASCINIFRLPPFHHIPAVERRHPEVGNHWKDAEAMLAHQIMIFAPQK